MILIHSLNGAKSSWCNKYVIYQNEVSHFLVLTKMYSPTNFVQSSWNLDLTYKGRRNMSVIHKAGTVFLHKLKLFLLIYKITVLNEEKDMTVKFAE